jgi:hypothetical protein
VEISVPVPSDADSPRFKTSVGSAKYVPEKNVVIWSIKSFPVSTQGQAGVLVGDRTAKGPGASGEKAREPSFGSDKDGTRASLFHTWVN